MKETHASHLEIQAIQEKLQAIRAGQGAAPAPTRLATPTSAAVKAPASAITSLAGNAMVEMFPSTLAPAAGNSSPYPAATSQAALADLAIAADVLSREAPVREAPLHRPLPPVSPAGSPSPYSSHTYRLTNLPPEAPAVGQPADEVMRQLEAKAQQINQLSVAQETAMQELKAIAQKLERDWMALEVRQAGSKAASRDLLPICEYVTTEVPCIERDASGAFVITSRAIDLFQSERDAGLTAQSLRRPQASNRSARPEPTEGAALEGLWTWLTDWLNSSAQQQSPRTAQVKGRSQTASQPVAMSWKTAAAWLIGGAVVRVAAEVVLALSPGLWLPVVGLIVAPAAIAAYRSTVAPQTSMTWGYRLFCIMIGLLAGGRLV